MAYTLNRRLAQLVDSNGQLNTGKIPNDYIDINHIADNTITSAMLHTSFTVSSSNLTAIDTDDVSEGSTNLYYTTARWDTKMAAADTDDLSEGLTNLYFTNERVDDRVNALLTAGTGITLTYDDANNTLTVAGAAQYGDSDVESYLSGGTGVTFSSGVISIGQDVGTSATPTFGNTIVGTLQATSFSDGTISGITFIDEDSFATNSATRVPTQQSIKAYVDAQVAGVVDSAPATLDTLNELAAALGDDANFSTTTSTALGNRLRVDTAAQGLTGTQQANAITNLGITATKAELNVLDGITATVTELNYTDGVTSNIQTQLDAKLASSSYTAADVLTKIKTVDGAGSGLDADLLDGISSGSFLRSDATDTASGNLTLTGTNSYGSTSSYKSFIYGGVAFTDYANAALTNGRMYFQNDNFYLRGGGEGTADASTNTTLQIRHNGNFREVWHSGNDGSGSGLDADTVDGIQAASFLRSDANDTYTGTLSLATNSSIRLSNQAGYGIETSDGFRVIDSVDAVLRIGDTGKHTTVRLHGGGNDDFRVFYGGADYEIWHAGNDGSGSGLDADLLDGVQGSSYLRSNAADTMTGRLTASGGIDGLTLGNGGISGVNYNITGVNQLTIADPGEGIVFTGTTTVTLYAIDNATDSIMNFSNASELRRNNNKVWDAGNDGSGSGLDADTVDGIQAASFLRSDADDVASGVVEFSNRIEVDEIRSYANQDLTITCGESANYLTKSTHDDEIIRLAGEGGVIVYASSNNLTSGLNKSTTLINTSGDMSISNNLYVPGNMYLTGGGTIEAPSVGGGEALNLVAAGGITVRIDSNGNSGDTEFFKVLKHSSDELFSVQESGDTKLSEKLYSSNDNHVHWFGNTTSWGTRPAIGRAAGTNFHMSGSIAGDLIIGAETDRHIYFATNVSAGNPINRMRIEPNGIVRIQSAFSNQTVATHRDVWAEDNGELGYNSSVRASKMNIEDVTDASWLYNVNPKTFYKRLMDEEGNYLEENTGIKEYGFIAEDIEEHAPELCFYDIEREVDEDGNIVEGGTITQTDLAGINYSHLTSPMLKLIQQQKQLIDDLTARIEALENP